MTRRFMAILCVGFLLAGCALFTRGQDSASAKNREDKRAERWNANPDEVFAPLDKAPHKAVNRKNPLEGDSDAIPAGAKLFDQHCAECHGEMAEGTRKGPSLRAMPVQQATPGTLFWILTNGVVRKGMPVWSKLPEPERWQLVSYIKSLTASMTPRTEQPQPPPAEPAEKRLH